MKNAKIKFILFIYLLYNLFNGLSLKAQTNITPPDNSLSGSNQTLSNPIQISASNQQLPLFGSSFFNNQQSYENMLLIGGGLFPKEYSLGPGDKLGIYLLGKSQQSFEVIVNVEGKIFIPAVGMFYVSGLKIEEFQKFLEKELTKYYENFTVNIMLIEAKRIPVFVVGDVLHPGKYFLSSINTVLDAVLMAGGPNERGSRRNIEVYRENKLCAIVDLYQFLMKGITDSDLFLQPRDKIVIPLIDAVVSVEGEVKREARFELKSNNDERISELIELAGGFTDLAYLDQIEISRSLPNAERFVQYVNFNAILKKDSCSANVHLKNDDKIVVYSKLEQTYKKSVFIHGEVKKPGEYPLEENLHVSDLILKAGNLTRSAYLLDCEVAKIDPKYPTVIKKVDLQKILRAPISEENLILEEDDRVFIRQIPEWEVGPTIEIIGEVQFPGIYAITEDSTTLSGVLKSAGGFTDKALLREASLIRQSSKISIDKEYMRLRQIPRDQLTKSEYEYLVMKENTQDIGRIVVDFCKLSELKDKTEDVELKDGDVINIPQAPNLVYVTGRISLPGGILYAPKKGINYYLNKAGGVSWDARKGDIKVTKVNGEIINDEDVKKLEPGDIIWVPRKPDRDWWRIFRETIAVIAQVATVYIVIDRALINK